MIVGLQEVVEFSRKVRIRQEATNIGAADTLADLEMLTEAVCSLVAAESQVKRSLRLVRRSGWYRRVQDSHENIDIALILFIRNTERMAAGAETTAMANMLRGQIEDARGLLDLANTSLGFLQDGVRYYDSVLIGAAAFFLSALAIVMQLIPAIFR